MQLIDVIIFGLVLSGSECFIRIIEKTSDWDESARLAEAAVTTLVSCYENEVITVGVAGISEQILQKILLSKQFLLPVTLIGDDTARTAVNNRTVNKGLRHKLQLFLVETSSSQQLDWILGRIKKSQWWNHMATYLIIDWQSQKNQQSCVNAYEYLWTAWKRNLLNALYVCHDKPVKKTFVYSYNPYTSQAPAPWRLEKTYKGKRGHPWTIFVREYRSDKLEMCRSLNFVKTHDLGGYEIDCFIKSTMWNQHDVETIMDQHRYPGYIFKALKATPRLTLYSLTSTNQISLSQIGMRNITTNHISGLFDIFLGLNYDRDLENVTHSSRIINGGLGILTQYKGGMSQLGKILAVLDRSTRFGLCLVMLKTLLFFKFFMRQPLGSAIMNVCRIITNSTLVKVPKKIAPRLYLAGIFFLVVTIVGIYQGKIASLLTKPTPLPDVETMKDLNGSPHKIHGFKGDARHFTDPIFTGRFVGHNSTNCTKYVIKDPSAACVMERLDLVSVAIDLKLHVSRDTIVPMDLVFPLREDWPIEERLNEIIASFTESHVDWYIYHRDQDLKLEIAKYHAKWEKNRPCKVINLSEIGFAFAILGIGLVLATVSFIVEVAIRRARFR